MNGDSKEKLNIRKEVVTVNTNVKKVVAKKKDVAYVEERQNSGIKSINSHMEENQASTKFRVDYKSVFTYILLIVIVGIGIFLVLNFFDKYNDGAYKRTTASTTTRGLATTTTTTQRVYYETTTAAPTQATHTVFDKNRR
ncbi:MAG: hypothetical protein OSJ65_05605 [Bacilli bacterium]|nr:hypothetical protein [Bacilli bacterium]